MQFLKNMYSLKCINTFKKCLLTLQVTLTIFFPRIVNVPIILNKETLSPLTITSIERSQKNENLVK